MYEKNRRRPCVGRRRREIPVISLAPPPPPPPPSLPPAGTLLAPHEFRTQVHYHHRRRRRRRQPFPADNNPVQTRYNRRAIAAAAAVSLGCPRDNYLSVPQPPRPPPSKPLCLPAKQFFFFFIHLTSVVHIICIIHTYYKIIII